jgi:hypothetical protein
MREEVLMPSCCRNAPLSRGVRTLAINDTCVYVFHKTAAQPLVLVAVTLLFYVGNDMGVSLNGKGHV